MLSQTTVVIPCFNAEEFIAEAIESCRAEGVPDQHIIVVDDGSTDDSPARVVQLGSNIRLHSQQNGGASKARSTGLALVETPFVIFLDADDTYAGGMLAALETELHAANADLGLGTTQVVRMNGDLGPRRCPPDISHPQKFLVDWLVGNTVQTNSQMWRTSFLREAGGWRDDMRTLEEIEIVIRAVAAGARLVQTGIGCSMHIDRGNADRVSYGNSKAVIQSAIEGFTAIEPMVSSDKNALRALGQRFYLQARSAFRHGHHETGYHALCKARACGFSGHIGTPAHRLISSVLGLKFKERWLG